MPIIALDYWVLQTTCKHSKMFELIQENDAIGKSIIWRNCCAN